MNWLLLQNSVMVAGGTALVSAVFGYAAAVFAAAVGERIHKILFGLALVNLALPSFLVTNAWLELLGQGGLWRRWLPVNIYSLGGVIGILCATLWPITFLMVRASFSRLQPGQIEAEPALREWRLIRWLMLPASRSAVLQSSLIVFVLAFNNFAVPAILQTKVYPAELWVSFNTTFEYGRAARLSWPLCLGPVLLLLALRSRRVVWSRSQAAPTAALIRERLGSRFMSATGLLTVALLLVGLAVPAGQLAFTGRTWLEMPDAFHAGQAAVWHSVMFAAVVATLCAVIGILLWQRRAMALLWLCFLIPGVLLGIVLIYGLNRSFLVPFYQSAGVVVLGLTLRYLALSWTGARQAMEAIPRGYADFARLNGASRGETLRHVYWPCMRGEIGAIWMVTYLLCLWDVETLVLIVPPGGETVALRIFNLLHYGHNGQVNALCAILLGVAVLPLVVYRVGRALGVVPGTRWAMALLACGGAAFVTGCGRTQSDSASIQSALFSSVQIVGARGTALGQFNKPRSLTVDNQDNLYVVDMTGRVQKFSSNGVYLLSWQMPETEKGKPKGMCCDTQGNIVVVEPHYARVNHFTPAGKLVLQWGQYGTNSGQLCLPRAVTVNSQGDLWLCEYTLVDRLQEFSKTGQRWERSVGRAGRRAGEFNRPEGLATDRQDRLYVADSCNHRVQVFSPKGEFLRAYGEAGSGPGQLSYPYDIQVDPAGRQYVCEFGNSRVQIFDPDGKPLETLGGPGAAPGQFSNPWSIALDSAGNLYVADSQNHRVQKFLRKPAAGFPTATSVKSFQPPARGGHAGGATLGVSIP